MAEQKLQGKKIAFIATDMVEEVELTKPWEAVEEAGGQPELVSIETGDIQAFNHYDKSNTYKVDKDFSSARVDDYDGLVIPGGVGNPDTMRSDDDAVDFVRSFFEAGKPVAVICHGPWMLVEADVVRGRKVTSSPTRGSSRPGSPTTCRRSARRWSRSSARACTRASARRRPRPRSGRGGAAGSRRHAHRRQLPARARLVPRLSSLRHRPPGVAAPPPHRDGRRPVRGSGCGRRRGAAIRR